VVINFGPEENRAGLHAEAEAVPEALKHSAERLGIWTDHAYIIDVMKEDHLVAVMDPQAWDLSFAEAKVADNDREQAVPQVRRSLKAV